MPTSFLRLSFKVEPDDVQIARIFENIAKKGTEFKTIFEKIADEFYESQEKVFGAEGAFEGRARWAELSPRYRAWKEKNYPGMPILQLTGKMKSSLVGSGAEGSVYEVSNKELTVGTNVPYAIFHQRGTRRMPQRKIIEVTDRQKLRWVHIVHYFMMANVSEEWKNLRAKPAKFYGS